MEVAKITLWDGQVFYTNDFSFDKMREWLDRAKAKIKPEVGTHAQVDLIEMTPEEYQAIPASLESAEFFGV